ncbi:MAG: hypothetical protein K9H49_18605 [Bacteroidales bacterium]|nr:hypothetical protein [Bacteroidales bacterium]
MLLAILVLACNKENTNVIAHVNQYPISKSELKYWMLLQRAEVYIFFYEEYGIIDSDDFWEQKVEGDSPLDKLKELALEKAVRCKAQQILALEKGIVKQIDFDQIISNMDDENKRRKAKVEKGEVVYGQLEFTKRTYFAHEFDKMILKLIPELIKSELKPSEEDLKSLIKNEDFSLEDNYGFYQMQYAEKNYQQYIDGLVEKAEIEINRKNWKAVDAFFIQ